MEWTSGYSNTDFGIRCHPYWQYISHVETNNEEVTVLYRSIWSIHLNIHVYCLPSTCRAYTTSCKHLLKHADVGGSAPYRLGTAQLEAEKADQLEMAVSPTVGVSPSRPFALPNEFRLITRSYSHLVLISSLKDEVDWLLQTNTYYTLKHTIEWVTGLHRSMWSINFRKLKRRVNWSINSENAVLRNHV